MKKKFSKSWIKSKQPRKQRKYKYNAPMHLKHRFLSSNLSKELRKRHNSRSLPLKKGDEVVVMKGEFDGKKGKILNVIMKKCKVAIEGLNRKKSDGSKVNILFEPSNLQIISLNQEDSKRINKNQKEKSNASKEK